MLATRKQLHPSPRPLQLFALLAEGCSAKNERLQARVLASNHLNLPLLVVKLGDGVRGSYLYDGGKTNNRLVRNAYSGTSTMTGFQDGTRTVYMRYPKSYHTEYGEVIPL
eukprot:scaffold248885_cov19-Prasinocladus_malaysianus.AAC.1